MNRRRLVSALVSAPLWGHMARVLPAWAALPATDSTAPAGQGGGLSPFRLAYQGGFLSSLRYQGDAFDTDYLAAGSLLGAMEFVWRRPGGAWNTFQAKPETCADPASHTFVLADAQGKAAVVQFSLSPERDILRWTIQVRNEGAAPLEVGDLALMLPMHSSFSAKEPPTASVLKHSFISGHGSFLFWMRSNSVGPYLVLTLEPDTSLEYWEHPRGREDQAYRVFLHSVAASERIRAKGGRWRQPHTSALFAPAGQPGDMRAYHLQFAWAMDYDGVRDRLVAAKGLDIEVAGGMAVPVNLSTVLAVRTQTGLEGITAEHPQSTRIEAVPSLQPGWNHYRITLQQLGENMLTLHQAGGRTTRLELFCMQPLETLVSKRAAFIRTHQVRDAAKWYNGLFAEWNLQSQVQLSPDNYDRIRGWRIYEVTCDDPGLSKPAFLASKNVEFPQKDEIEALDYYIEHFVWGGLQRTTEESDSYGIYGIPDWKHNRESPDPGNKGRRHIWRAYDYPHIVVLYYSMYRIAMLYPAITTKLSAAAYLERAYQTALGMFTIPWRVTEWSAYETGFYNEAVIPDLIDDLVTEGRQQQAATLRMHWEKKVSFFINGAPNLFGSEYAFDSTGFESTAVIARYARQHPGAAGTTPSAVAQFALKQIKANLFCRGVVEKAYYYYGSDYRGGAGDSFTLTYMSPMGGAGVLDHALHDGRDPDATLRLANASLLSTWSLMNAGPSETDFGYWYPGAANDGGTGGGFEPAAYGMTWLEQPSDRGPWYYSSETDLGYCGFLRNAATIVADDPLFGLVCLGGDLRRHEQDLHIMPKDGVRRRLYLRTAALRIDITVTGARFAADQAVKIAHNGEWEVPLEIESSAKGTAEFRLEGLAEGELQVLSGETGERSVTVRNGSARIALQVPKTGQVVRFHVPQAGKSA